MKILPCRQHSDEWFEARAGLPTASEIGDALLTPLFKEREGESPMTYLAKKLAEKWEGGPIIKFTGSWATDQGNVIEEEAVPWFAFTQGCKCETGRFITTDDGKFGCSPDAVVTWPDGRKSGLECKGLQPTQHFLVLLKQAIPKDYIVQVHSSLFAADELEWWDFLAYRRDCPNFILRVERDPKIQSTIKTVIDDFHKVLTYKFDTMKKEYYEANRLDAA